MRERLKAGLLFPLRLLKRHVIWTMAHPAIWAGIVFFYIGLSIASDHGPASWRRIASAWAIVGMFHIWAIAVIVTGVWTAQWWLDRREKTKRRQGAAYAGKIVTFVEIIQQEYRCADCQQPTDDPMNFKVRLQKTAVGERGERRDMYELVCTDCFAQSLLAMGFALPEIVRLQDPRRRGLGKE